ncbi:hypothetical protein [Azohydromonas caseinilytica]|uniref:Uncharacterized protein n=1 Tax=Azohydromonas caseinilytica TaxID=2728836 RepID=A0A848FIE1_9BURK|nr:hypothetical protein [Azohydromonas caseinilytica]NML17970.1 hypothetical protein [Azohydromonas caseinilytica]
MSHQQVNENAVAAALQGNLGVPGAHPILETRTAPLPYAYVGHAVLLGPRDNHAADDAATVYEHPNCSTGSFTIELRKTGMTGTDRKWVVDIQPGPGSFELKQEIERCIHAAVAGNWEVRF